MNPTAADTSEKWNIILQHSILLSVYISNGTA